MRKIFIFFCNFCEISLLKVMLVICDVAGDVQFALG